MSANQKNKILGYLTGKSVGAGQLLVLDMESMNLFNLTGVASIAGFHQ